MQQQMMPNTHENEQAVLFICFITVVLLCWVFFDVFVYGSCWILYWLWRTADIFPRFHLWIAERINLLAHASGRADSISFTEWLALMNRTSGILLIFFFPTALISGVALVQHPALAFRSKRVINADTLPHISCKFSPSVIPIMKHGRQGLMNDTNSENAWALRPEEFAEHHQLISRKTLNTDLARKVFESQLGCEIKQLSEWLPYERALFVIFGLQFFLNDRKSATKLLDDLNRSCLVSGLRMYRKNKISDPLFSLADKGFKRLYQLGAVTEWMNKHLFVRTALTGLFAHDLRLSPSRFRWLKGIDRTLWYALHTAGTAKVFIEGAGIVAHTRAENMADKYGLKIRKNMVSQAICGLQTDLENIGLIHPVCEPKATVRKKEFTSVFNEIYSPDND